MPSKTKSPHPCPVCKKTMFSNHASWEICPVCDWEDDALQERDPDFDTGANYMSLNEYRTMYKNGWRPDWTK